MVTTFGLEYEVDCLAVSERVNDKEEILKRLFEINRSILPMTSARAERIYQKLCKVFERL